MFRRLLLLALIVMGFPVLVGLGVWGYVANNQQQINQLLSKQISDTLGLPISLQRSHIGFHPTPTLDFHQIKIDTNSSNFKLSINQLSVGLRWQDLLNGQLVCTKLIIDSPDIYWQIPPHGPAQSGVDHASPPGVAIDSIRRYLTQATIHNGSIYILDNRYIPGQNWQLGQVTLSLSGLAPQQELVARLEGNLVQGHDDSAPLSCRLQLNQLANDWPQARIQLHSTIENFQLPAQLQQNSPYQLQGAVNLTLEANGSIKNGLTAQLALASAKDELRLASPHNRPMAIQSAQIAGQLLQTDQGYEIKQAKLALNHMQLQGNGTIEVRDGALPSWQATLNSNTLAMSDLIPWLPQQVRNQLPAFINDAKFRGQHLVVAGVGQQINGETLRNLQLSFQIPQLNHYGLSAKALRGKLDYRPGHLALKTTALQLSPELDTFAVSGPLDLAITRVAKHHWTLNMGLDKVGYDLAGCFKKAPDTPGNLALTVKQQDALWTVDQGQLRLPELNLDFSGRGTDGDHFELDVAIANFELASISQHIKLLDWMQLRGKVDVRQKLVKDGEAPLHNSGSVILHDCAISPTHVIAPIHHINGTIAVNGVQAEAPKLSIGLGQSTMEVYGLIEDLRRPVAQLHAKGDGVIARDLVFNSADARLYNLDGRINIHARGIDFVRASVELQQGTQATVTGELLFAGPFLELDIAAPYADIDEIIALWHGEPGHGHPVADIPHHTGNDTDQFGVENIHIQAEVEQGIISGFKFSNTYGTIHHRANRLRIEPLRFEADAGYGVGTILVQHQPEHSLLEIEGSVVNIDADKVYSQLLKHSGLVTGRLFGEFTLTGPIGSQFLPNSNGEFHLNIQRGVLRKFKVLSKAFSLLNVAQLFSLKLPDMAEEGMPFKRLTSDFTLTNGRLQSDNLKIDSSAMNIDIRGGLNLVSTGLDLEMGIKPLGTIDTLFSHLPVAGWLLTGEEQAVVTANFSIGGNFSDPKVEMQPISTVSNKVFGIFKRTLKLPQTLIKDPEKILLNPERN